MFDTAEQIRRQLLAGEDSSVEFKVLHVTERGACAPNAESLAGEMVAFANAEGGADAVEAGRVERLAVETPTLEKEELPI